MSLIAAERTFTLLLPSPSSPRPKVAEAGHARRTFPIKPSAVDAWLDGSCHRNYRRGISGSLGKESAGRDRKVLLDRETNHPVVDEIRDVVKEPSPKDQYRR